MSALYQFDKPVQRPLSACSQKATSWSLWSSTLNRRRTKAIVNNCWVWCKFCWLAYLVIEDLQCLLFFFDLTSILENILTSTLHIFLLRVFRSQYTYFGILILCFLCVRTWWEYIPQVKETKTLLFFTFWETKHFFKFIKQHIGDVLKPLCQERKGGLVHYA